MKWLIKVKNISKIFKEARKSFYALKDITFSIKKGEIFGVLGPNGSGKTTLLNIMTGLLLPDSGTVTISGRIPWKDPSVLEQLNSVSAGVRFHWSLRVKDVFSFYARIYGLTKKQRIERTTQLIKFFDLKDLLNKKVEHLSTGQATRLALAKAMINSPKILLLDEPTMGLDPDIAAKVRTHISRINKRYGTTIILTSHYMDEVEQLADRIAFLSRGRLVDIGTIKKVKLRHLKTYDVIFSVERVKNRTALLKNGFKIRKKQLFYKLPIEKSISDILYVLLTLGIRINDIRIKRPTLEDYFIKMLGKNETK